MIAIAEKDAAPRGGGFPKKLASLLLGGPIIMCGLKLGLTFGFRLRILFLGFRV